MPKFFGYNPPWTGGQQNVMSQQVDERLIKNDILQLIMTEPGDRVMRSDFGVHLRSVVFESNTDDTINSIKSELRNKLKRYEPRVDFSTINVVPDIDRHGIMITLIGRIRTDPTKLIDFQRFIQLGV